MRVLVFGAGGATGLHLVEQGLIRGDEITAFIHRPGRLTPAARLRIVVGDVLDFDSVVAAMENQQVVVSALGTRRRQPELLERAMATIVAAMKATHVRRIVALGAAGALNLDEALSHQNLRTKLVMRTVASTVLRGALADSLALERVLGESDRDYTIVRAARLTDAPRTGSYRVDEEALPPGAVSISRGDVAEFMLMQLDSDKYVRKSPYVGY